jgi:hypothetical protein
VKEKQEDDEIILFSDLIWIWDAFCTLSDMRNVGMNGPLAITVDQILSYCILTGIRDPDHRDELLRYIQVLDPIWLRHYYDEAEKKHERERKKSKNSQRK